MNKKILHDRYRYSSRFNYKFKKDINHNYYDEFNIKYPKEKYWKKFNCFICDDRNFEIISEVDRYGYYHPTGFCNNCGHIQQTEFMDNIALEIFYKDYFRKIYDIKTPYENFEFTKLNRSHDIFHFTNSVIRAKKVLDIGCGTGGVLSAYKENGCDVLGLDFDDDYLSEAKNNNIFVKKGSIDVLRKDEKFDLIIISHVLEHVLNPVVFLKEIINHLSNDGVIYIEVPSLESVLEGLYEFDLRNFFHNTHVSNFSLDSLNLMAKKTNLKMIKSNNLIQSCWVKSLNENISEKDKKYVLKKNQILISNIEKNRNGLFTNIQKKIFKIRIIIVKILEKLKIKHKIKFFFKSK